MSSTLIGLLVLAGTFGASMLSIQIRRFLPAHHMESDSKDVLKLVVGLTSTLTALVLGLLISSAYSAFQLQRVEIQDLGTRSFEVDRILAALAPDIDTTAQRRQLHQIVAAINDNIWPPAASAAPPVSRADLQIQGEALFAAIASLPTTSNMQRVAQARATQLLEQMSGTWHTLMVQRGGSLAAPILWVLTCWLVILFFGFGLFTSYNHTVATALLVGAAAVSAAIFLIVDLNQPYSGWMHLPRAALTTALAQMGR